MRAFVPATLVLFALVSPATAHDRPAPAVDLAGGTYLFADDGVVREGALGGAVRFYLLPRLSIGPEAVFIAGTNHNHFILTGNVTFDFLGPDTPRVVTPYVVAGAGLYRTSEEFIDSTFTSSEGAFTAGGGVRVRVNDRISLGGEARMGWEPHIRLNAVVGVRLGR
jgi:hypothetical protein